VPAALMNLRKPSSLIKSRFAAAGAGGAANIDLRGRALPNITPDTGRMDKFLIASLRFISVSHYCDYHAIVYSLL
jgi:hypothetical protein